MRVCVHCICVHVYTLSVCGCLSTACVCMCVHTDCECVYVRMQLPCAAGEEKYPEPRVWSGRGCGRVAGLCKTKETEKAHWCTLNRDVRTSVEKCTDR